MRAHALRLRLQRTRVLLASGFIAFLAACGSGGGGYGGVGGTGGTGGGGGGGGGVTTADQQYNLDRLNYYRGLAGVPPLVLDSQLTTFATAGSAELMADHTPHKHFNDAATLGTLFTVDGFSGSAGENQGDPNGWPPAGSVQAQIDQILAAMWGEGPVSGSAHGHYTNMVNAAFTRVGVGLLQDAGGRLYFTNDLSE